MNSLDSNDRLRHNLRALPYIYRHIALLSGHQLFFSTLVLIGTLSSGLKAQPLDLQEVLRLSRDHAAEPHSYRLMQEAFEAEARAIGGAFDGQISASWQKSRDRGELNFITSGDERRQDQFTSNYRTLLPTGTSLEVGSAWTRQGVNYPIPPSSLDVLNTPRFNPEYEALLGLTVRQSLWRNFRAREIHLQREVAMGQAIEPAFQLEVELQSLQGEAESWYWQLIAFKDQVRISETMLATAKRYALAMEQRRQSGRADNVDVADADSMVIGREAELLSFRIERDQIRENLRIRMFGHQLRQRLEVPSQLPSEHPWPLPAHHAAEALAYAERQRFDLKMLKKQGENSQKAAALAKEQAAPDLGLFVSYHKRGFAENPETSWQNIGDGTISSIGIDFNWVIGNTESRELRRAASLREQSLGYREEIIKRSVSQSLRSSFQRLQGAKQQEDLADTHIRSLRHKKQAEQIKLQQARSDEVAVLRYELEVLSAERQRVDARLRKLLSTAEIRSILHAYPQSGS